MAFKMRLVPGDYKPSEFINMMEWPFDRYTVVVSDNRCTVRFHCDDPDDPGNIAYLRGGEYHPEEFGWWTVQVLQARDVGLDVFRSELRADRLAHLRREPPCPFKAKVRQRRLGGDDLALAQALP